MSKSRRQHPAAARAALEQRADDRNAVIRRRCETPGFGYLVLFCRRSGAKHGEDAETYAEATAIRDAQLHDYDWAWIFEKDWNAAMSITADPATRGAAITRWLASRRDADL